MTIKQQGGVFGRNPTFNDVTIEGQLTFDGDIDINSDLKVSGDIETTGNVIIATSGKGIDFSATAGTGTSELLDDYEEGTWTPVLTVNGFSGGPTLSSSVATYTKVGRVVHATCRLVMSAATYPSSYCQITGTPFVSDVGSNFVGVYDGSNPGDGTQGGVLTMGAAGIFTTPMGTTNTSTAWNFTVTYAVA
jgi:hypothetical protein